VVAEMRLQRRIEDVFPEGGEDDRQDESREYRPDDDEGGSEGEQTEPEKHAEPAPTVVGHRCCERTYGSDDAAGGECVRQGDHVHPHAACQHGKEWINHPV
jgi:hypothetical protein